MMVAALLTVILVLAVVIMALLQLPIDAWLAAAVGAALGLWFDRPKST
jgi:hypothetical protein